MLLGKINRNAGILILFAIIAGLIYLPKIGAFGYYNDDWYSMYAARVAGPNIFHAMYSIDRPGRAYLMEPLYILFQGNPLYYNLSAFIFRLAGALSLLWVLQMLWPKKRLESALAALLFLIYPGFLSQPNAIDFQSHLLGIWFAFISLGLMLKAFNAKGPQRWLLWAGTLLTGWAYLSQMEYYIGFEAVRVLLVVLIAAREAHGRRQIMLAALKKWGAFSVIPALYLFWRIFLFDNQRATTDVGTQLGQVVSSPLATMYSWLISFIQSFLNVLFLAWSVPLAQRGFSFDLSETMAGLALAALVTIIGLAGLWFAGKPVETDGLSSTHWRSEALWLGLAWVVVGLLPVVFANRTVLFPEYSRYGLVSAPGAMLVLVALLAYLAERRVQVALVALMLFSAGLTHYANAITYADFSSDVRSFWWQASWRIPQMEKGTTIVAQYPRDGIKEDSSVWGPANQIYYPEKVNSDKVQAGIYAILLDHEATVRILNRERQVYRKEIIVDTYRNYRNILILTQPGPDSCLQVIDGKQPEYSSDVDDSILVIGPYSETEHILLNEPSKSPPAFLFGAEPDHGWCYYYEKASLARQQGNWEAVLALGKKSSELGLAPKDQIEWMPFLEAYAQAGDADELKSIAPRIKANTFVHNQICTILKAMQSLRPQVQQVITDLYCVVQS